MARNKRLYNYIEPNIGSNNGPTDRSEASSGVQGVGMSCHNRGLTLFN